VLRRRKAPREVTLTRADGAVVCERCLVAATPLRRIRGLLGRKDLPPGEGLLLRPASSIHTLFMRFPIDAVFLDRDLIVRKITTELKPWRFAFGRSRAILELAAGECARRGIAPGERLSSVEPP
jgi:uncharacterized protein